MHLISVNPLIPDVTHIYRIALSHTLRAWQTLQDLRGRLIRPGLSFTAIAGFRSVRIMVEGSARGSVGGSAVHYYFPRRHTRLISTSRMPSRY